jgi:hypothetical protein
MFKNIDDRADLFLTPIPKWITRYGFVSMILIVFGLVIFTSIVRFPQNIDIPVVIEKNRILAETDFSSFQNIYAGQKIRIEIPFLNTEIEGNLEKANAWVENRTIFVPIATQGSMGQIPFNTKLACQGHVTLENETLLKRIFERKNPRMAH